MAYYDVTSQYQPDGLVTQSNGLNFNLPGASGGSGMGLNLGGFGESLGALAQQSLDMRRQQAMQQMALAERQQALQEAQLGAQLGQADRAFNYQAQQDRTAQHRADVDRYTAQNEARKSAQASQRAARAANVPEAAYGQMIGGFGIVPGLISASGNTPGAVMTGHRVSQQGPTQFAQPMGQSRASMGPTEMFQPNFQGQFDNSPTAGEKSAAARRQLLALQMPATPAAPARASVSGALSVRR